VTTAPLETTASAVPLSLRGAGVDFDGRPALDGVDLDLHRGALTVVAGPNGAGKSTLLEVIAGTRPLSRGTRSGSLVTAFVPQRAAVSDRLPVTVRDVVTVGTWGHSAVGDSSAGRDSSAGSARRVGRTSRPSRGARARGDVAAAMESLEITRLASLPFSSLSGGQRQRALLAQGLVRGAEMLLLDEPTTGLDTDSAGLIRDIMRSEARRGVAVVCVSHDAGVLGIADRVVRLEDGAVVPDATR
jgi:zinc/manganese transport system ATP-binding protein